MIIVGAKGFAKEILEVLHQLNKIDHLAFYDDISTDLPDIIYNKFNILRNKEDVFQFMLKNGNEYTLGIGNPIIRKKLNDKFIMWDGITTSTISATAEIGSYNVEIEKGCNVLPLSIIANGVKLGKGCIVYYNSMLTHDCQIGDFVEISPGATLLGACIVGDYSQIGANATILPKIIIGSNVIVAAGAVVTKNVPDNCMIAGVPAVIKKKLLKLEL